MELGKNFELSNPAQNLMTEAVEEAVKNFNQNGIPPFTTSSMAMGIGIAEYISRESKNRGVDMREYSVDVEHRENKVIVSFLQDDVEIFRVEKMVS